MSVLKNQLTQYLFIDIETVSNYRTFDAFYEANPRLAELWLKKSKKFYELPEYKDIHDVDNAIYFDKASIYPEFGRIVAITLGFFDVEMKKRLKVISSDNELEILTELVATLKSIEEKVKGKANILFGHNISSFDVPYIAKRFVFNGYTIPNLFNFSGKKPWEMESSIFDTMTTFKFGSFEIISFDLLCAMMNVESPKKVMDGSEVNTFYYTSEDGLNLISEYNKSDVSALMDVSIKLSELRNL
jgi:DNA polymerase elongation subunit (family B)